MMDLFVMGGEQMTWFVNKECNIEGLAVRRNDIFVVHLSHLSEKDFSLSKFRFDGVPVDKFKGIIYLADVKKMAVSFPFDGVIPGKSIVLLQQITVFFS